MNDDTEQPQADRVENAAQALRDAFAQTFTTPAGKRVLNNLEKQFLDSPKDQAPISGDQMRGRMEVLLYIHTNTKP